MTEGLNLLPLESSSKKRGVYFLHMYSCGKISATFDLSSRWNYLCDFASLAWYSKRAAKRFHVITSCQ
jgi:hypothetical protein